MTKNYTLLLIALTATTCTQSAYITRALPKLRPALQQVRQKATNAYTQYSDKVANVAQNLGKANARTHQLKHDIRTHNAQISLRNVEAAENELKRRHIGLSKMDKQLQVKNQLMPNNAKIKQVQTTVQKRLKEVNDLRLKLLYREWDLKDNIRHATKSVLNKDLTMLHHKKNTVFARQCRLESAQEKLATNRKIYGNRQKGHYSSENNIKMLKRALGWAGACAITMSDTLWEKTTNGLSALKSTLSVPRLKEGLHEGLSRATDITDVDNTLLQ